MKCPKCGYWNRASFPKCYRCGEPLPLALRRRMPLPADDMEESGQAPTSPSLDEAYRQPPEEGVSLDAADKLAHEMQHLHERKKRGAEKQRALRARGAAKGYAPSELELRGVQRRNRVFVEHVGTGVDPYKLRDEEKPVDYDSYAEGDAVYSRSLDDLDGVDRTGPVGTTRPLPIRRVNRARRFGWRRFLPIVIILLTVGALGLSYTALIKPMLDRQAEEETGPEQPLITASILDDMAAHTIRIPAEEGAQIYIKELRRSYLATGGYAMLQVADYTWYELKETLTEPTMEVTLTPFIKTGTGEQKAMPLIKYEITIPLSPITLINPDSAHMEVTTPLQQIRFHVLQNSRVMIGKGTQGTDEQDYSSYVNTQNGTISYNANIQPVGDNIFTIRVRSQYYRENTVTLNIYRAPQDIPLDLTSTLDDESSTPEMTITGTTRPGANINVKSAHKDLKIDKLGSTGEFSFKAVFDRIGTNTVEIEATFPGRQATTVTYQVYYLPPADLYTKKAWALDDGWGYQELMGNTARRVASSQVYMIVGPVLDIISARPQLAVVDVNDGKGNALKVLLENQTKTNWEVGKRYRIYADAFGLYGGMPRLTARYTYKPKN